MSIYLTLYLVALFFVLTPGVLVTLPPKSDKITVAITHAIVFAVIYQLTFNIVKDAVEGFKGGSRSSSDRGNRCTKDSECSSKKCQSQGKGLGSKCA